MTSHPRVKTRSYLSAADPHDAVFKKTP